MQFILDIGVCRRSRGIRVISWLVEFSQNVVVANPDQENPYPKQDQETDKYYFIQCLVQILNCTLECKD